MTALAALHRADIISKLRDGAFVEDIAQDLGISGPAITQVLSKDPEYLAAREQGAAKRLQEDYKDIRNSRDALSLARAREGFKASSWFAEREFPERWGARPTDRGLQISVVLAQQTGNGAVQEQPIAGVVVEAK